MSAPDPSDPSDGPARAPEQPICSARDCRRTATWALRWNNPKIHTPDRRKTWLACDEHRDHLGSFLSARGFLRETEPFSGGDEQQT
jgi:hypothetical protein